MRKIRWGRYGDVFREVVPLEQPATPRSSQLVRGLSSRDCEFMFPNATLSWGLWESTSRKWTASTRHRSLKVQEAEESKAKVQKTVPVTRSWSLLQRRLSLEVEQRHRMTGSLCKEANAFLLNGFSEAPFLILGCSVSVYTFAEGTNAHSLSRHLPPALLLAATLRSYENLHPAKSGGGI